MSKINCRFRECILATLCLSVVLFSGCTFPKSEQSKTDKSSEAMDESRKDETTDKDYMPLTTVNKDEDKPSVVLEEEGNSSEGPTIGKVVAGRVEELKMLEKIKILETRLKADEKERKKTSIQMKKLNKKISGLQKTKAEAVDAESGSGYLAEGSTIGLGIIDGDDELKVLRKVQRLEARLEAEKNRVKALKKELTDLHAAKESVEEDFANTKKELEEKSNNLLEKINTLETTLEKTASRAIAAEQELSPIKRELLKTQISETKTQQELYKLKIENLKKDDE